MKQASSAITWGAIGLTALGALTMPGCSDTAADSSAARATNAGVKQVDPYVMSKEDRVASKEARLGAIADVGNGMYIFPTTYFPETLADFQAAHPELRVVTFTQGYALFGGGYGYQSGCPANFFVLTAPK